MSSRPKANSLLIAFALSLIASPLLRSGPRGRGGNLRDLLCPMPWSKFGGGQFPGFLDGMWNFGSSYNTHRNNIEFGIPGTQMVAGGQVLKQDQIDNVLQFILNRAKMGVKPPPPKPISETEHYNLSVEVLAEGLGSTLGMEFIDERTAVFPNRASATTRRQRGRLPTHRQHTKAGNASYGSAFRLHGRRSPSQLQREWMDLPLLHR